jgi:hypothetical protein
MKPDEIWNIIQTTGALVALASEQDTEATFEEFSVNLKADKPSITTNGKTMEFEPQAILDEIEMVFAEDTTPSEEPAKQETTKPQETPSQKT